MTVDEIKSAINDANLTIFTDSEVAELTGTTPRNVSRWVASGRLRVYRNPVSQVRRIRKEHLLEFVQNYSHAVVADQEET